MEFTILTPILRPVIRVALGLQTYFYNRPRLDVDLIRHPEKATIEQNLIGISPDQDLPQPVPNHLVRRIYDYVWNFKLRIKNNSSNTAYSIKIEEIKSGTLLEAVDELKSLTAGEEMQLEFRITYPTTANSQESDAFMQQAFPKHLNEIQIIVSYTNEARTRFYTKFIATANGKVIEHLLMQP